MLQLIYYIFGEVGMGYRILLLTGMFFFSGCVQKHQINIGEISLQEKSANTSKSNDQYMSFTQEYYDNKRYPVAEYCDDKRALLTDDKFSTETYLKISNVRTKQNRVGKYPIWFLLNDDASNIHCIKKSANFINEEPFVVSSTDTLTLKLLQKNQEEKRVPIRELGVLIEFIGLVVPQTANFLLKSSNIINDPITQTYLNTMENAFTNGDLDGTKSRDFNTQTSSIKVKLYVPQGEGKKQELGYILLKPKYRTTLSTVELNADVPNFRYIYTSTDPRIEDIMLYRLKSKGVSIQREVDNFRHVAHDHIIEALSSLNVHLLNRFTSYDRGLILALALRQTDLYREFSRAVKNQDTSTVTKYLHILNEKDNPLHDLSKLLQATGIEYYSVMFQAHQLIKSSESSQAQRTKEQERIKEEQRRRQIAFREIRNFLHPVAKWSYIPIMFEQNAQIIDTQGATYGVGDLQQQYNRQENVINYGCYVDVQNKIHGVSIQDYLIHPNYTNGIKYNYMAISIDKEQNSSLFFYKLSSKGQLKITHILIDKNSHFIMESRLKEVLQKAETKTCKL